MACEVQIGEDVARAFEENPPLHDFPYRIKEPALDDALANFEKLNDVVSPIETLQLMQYSWSLQARFHRCPTELRSRL